MRVHMPCVARLTKGWVADRSAVGSSHGLSNLGVLQIKRKANAMRKENHTRTRALEIARERARGSASRVGSACGTFRKVAIPPTRRCGRSKERTSSDAREVR